ncbi:MAG TPA: hypothetical protein VM661_02845 [Candidatus Sulfotelmatobacter sp.]|jgi:hypothetical protein|nr:hypothetical protein [Candidatus Sulfotelmatobacter sp.]
MDYLAPLLIIGVVFLLMRGHCIGGGCCGGHSHGGHGGDEAGPADHVPEQRK